MIDWNWVRLRLRWHHRLTGTAAEHVDWLFDQELSRM